MENSKKVILILRVICSVSFFWLALTTGYTVYQSAQGWDNRYLIIAAIFAMYILVDYNSESLGEFMIRGIIDTGFRKDIGGLTFAIVFVLFTGRFTASTFMTYVSSKPLAKNIAPKTDKSDDIKRIEQSQKTYAARLDDLKTEKERLERSEARRIREAQKAGKKMVNDAIDAGGANFARLYRENNRWVKTDRKFRKTREAIKAAKVQADGLVYIEKEATREAQRAYMAALSGKDEISSSLTTLLVATDKEESEIISSYATTLYVFDFMAAILAIATLTAIVIYKVRTKTQYDGVFNEVLSRVGDWVKEDVLQATEKTALSGWELIFTGASKIPTLLRWLNVVFWVKFVGTIERLLKVDLDGNGNIGNTSVESQANPPTFRPVIGGFAQHRNEAQPPTNLPTNQAQNVGAFSPTSPTQNIPKINDVGVIPTSPTHVPTTPPPTHTQTSVNEHSDAPPPAPTNNRRKTPIVRQEAPTKDRAAGDKELDKMADAARAAFKRYINDSGNEQLFNSWKQWEAQLKRNGFTVSRSPSGTQVTIIKPKARSKKK